MTSLLPTWHRSHVIFRNGNIYYQISQVNLSNYIVELWSTLLMKCVTYKKNPVHHWMASVRTDFKDHQILTPCHRQGSQLLGSALDQAAHDTIQPGFVHIQEQGSLFQHFTALSVTNIPMTSNLDFPSFHWKPFSFVLSLSIHIDFLHVYKVPLNTGRVQWGLLAACPFKAEQDQLLYSWESCYSPFDNIHGPNLDLLPIFLMLGAPKQDAIIQMEPHEGRIEGNNHFPLPIGHPSSDAPPGYHWPSGLQVHTAALH